METLIQEVRRLTADYLAVNKNPWTGSHSYTLPENEDVVKYISFHPELGYKTSTLLQTLDSMLKKNRYNSTSKMQILQNMYERYDIQNQWNRTMLYEVCMEQRLNIGVAMKLLKLDPPIPLTGHVLENSVGWASCAMLDYMMNNAERHSIDNTELVQSRWNKCEALAWEVLTNFFTQNPLQMQNDLMPISNAIQRNDTVFSIIDIIYYFLLNAQSLAATRVFFIDCINRLNGHGMTLLKSTDSYSIERICDYIVSGMNGTRDEAVLVRDQFYMLSRPDFVKNAMGHSLPTAVVPTQYMFRHAAQHRIPSNDLFVKKFLANAYDNAMPAIVNGGSWMTNSTAKDFITMLWNSYRANPEYIYTQFRESRPFLTKTIAYKHSAATIRTAMFTRVLNMDLPIPREITDAFWLDKISPRLDDLKVAHETENALAQYTMMAEILRLCRAAMMRARLYYGNLQRFREMCFYEFVPLQSSSQMRPRAWYNVWLPLAPQFLLCSAAECVIHASTTERINFYVSAFKRLLEAICYGYLDTETNQPIIDEDLLINVVSSLLHQDCQAAVYQAMRRAHLGFTDYPRTFVHLHTMFSQTVPIVEYLDYVEKDLDVVVGYDKDNKPIQHPMHTRFASEEQRQAFIAELYRALKKAKKEFPSEVEPPAPQLGKRGRDASPAAANKRANTVPSTCAFHVH